MKNLFKSTQSKKMSIEALKATSANTQNEKLLSGIVGGLGFGQAECHPGDTTGGTGGGTTNPGTGLGFGKP